MMGILDRMPHPHGARLPSSRIGMICKVAGSLVAAALIFSQPGEAAFLVSDISKCDPAPARDTCILGLRGTIEAGDAEKLEQLFRSLEGNYKRDFIFMIHHSPGGNVIEAMKIGRLFRQRQATVVTNLRCASACVLLLAGAVRRAPFPGTTEIHRPFSTGDFETKNYQLAQKQYERMTGTVRAYIREMNLPDSLFEAMMAIPPHELKTLTQDEVSRFGLDSPDPVFEEMEQTKNARARNISRIELLNRRRLAEEKCSSTAPPVSVFPSLGHWAQNNYDRMARESECRSAIMDGPHR